MSFTSEEKEKLQKDFELDQLLIIALSIKSAQISNDSISKFPLFQAKYRVQELVNYTFVEFVSNLIEVSEVFLLFLFKKSYNIVNLYF